MGLKNVLFTETNEVVPRDQKDLILQPLKQMHFVANIITIMLKYDLAHKRLKVLWC